MPLSKEQRILLMEQLLVIDNKDRQVVPFKLNAVQKKLLLGYGNRNIILKARQMGMSTAVLADMFIEAITTPNTTCVVVSHEQHATERLFSRIRFFYDNMADPKPAMGRGSATEMTFPELNSTIYIGTARSMTFGRGDRIDRCHLSELAFYENGERLLSAIEDAVPLNGVITVESTPNGEDNDFYLTWRKAREGRNGYKPFFFAWWEAEEYRIAPGSVLALPRDRGTLDYSNEEQDLHDRFRLSDEQLRWRRRKIADKAALFYQEYPEDEVSCFIQTGEPVFDPDILQQLAYNCYDGDRHPQGFVIWQQPLAGEEYIIGADCSAGVTSLSAAAVLNPAMELVASFQGALDPAQFVEILRSMGYYYNTALLAVERNAQGYAVLAGLVDYPNIYLQQDFTTGKVSNKPGWWTSEQTKKYMISNFKECLPTLRCWDMNLVLQARGYRYIKFQPTPQTNDDLLISTMIALSVMQVQGISGGYIGSVPGWKW